jgi:nucleoside-diphosphate-sugar epimerase
MIPVSKKIGEVLTSFYGATFDISVTAIRPGHSYGPYCGAELGDLRMLRNIMEGSVNGKPVHLSHVDRDTKVRMIYVRDSAQAITMVHLAPKHAQRAYCLIGKAYSWGEVADVTRELSSNSKVTFGRYVPPPEGQRLPERLPHSLTLTSEFGFRPKYELKEGLREYIEWYRSGQP